MLLAAILTVTACSSGDGAETNATTVPASIALMSDDECAAAASDAVEPLQHFVDTYDTLTAEEWNALDPPADVQAAQDEVVTSAQAAVDRGCDPAAMELRLSDALESIEGRGEVGRAIAAALRGDGPMLGPPVPDIETTVPRDQVATTVTLEPGDSLSGLLRRLAPGSTVRFAAGTHRFSEPIVVDSDIAFVGAGEDETVISSSAHGVALTFIGPGGFRMSDLTIEHIGDEEASVVLAIEGPMSIERSTIRGGVSGTEEAEGGHGLVFAYTNVPGFPERSEAERVGALSITSSTIVDNASAGVLVTGTAAPTLVDVEIARNGGCGLCYTDSGGGSVSDSRIEDSRIGIQVGGDASPAVTGSRVKGSGGVGISIDGDARPTITRSIIEENGEIGIQVTGGAAPTLDRNTIRQHTVGVLVSDTGRPIVSNNGVVDHEIGIQVGGDARVDVSANTVWLSSSAAISFAERSTGDVRDNQIDRAAQVGIQAIDTARIEIAGNVIKNAGAVGITFADQARGTASANSVSGRDVGVQVDGRAAPDIVDNEIRDSVSAGMLYGESASGRASGNEISGAAAVGVLAGGTSSPVLEANSITRNAVGILFRERSSATARDNTVDTNSIGMQVLDRAGATIDANTIRNSADAGVVFGGTTSATFERNTMSANGDTSIQIGETARPLISENEIRGAGTYGVVYRDDATGEFRGNRVINHRFGMQLLNRAVPQIHDSSFEEIGSISIVYIDNSGGEIRGNTCPASAGIRVTAPADPNLGENRCTVSRSS